MPDSLASIANYLSVSGWRAGAALGRVRAVSAAAWMPPAIDPDQARPLSRWLAMGVRRMSNHPAVAYAIPARLIQPDGVGGAAFLVYPNYRAIRRYNPSDFYALSVGLLGDIVTA